MRISHFVLLLLIVFCGCKKNNDILPNRPPDEFKVNVNLEKDGKTVALNWEKAIDPDGDIIKYSVVFTDTLIKGSIDTFFQIKDIGFNIEKQGQVIAIDPMGLKTATNFNVVTKKNSAPTNVVVSQNIEEDGKTINITWTPATDLEGDEVSYTVILGDTLVKNVKDTKFVIRTLDFEVERSGVIIAKDIHGYSSQTPFLAKTLEDPYFQIPDVNFERDLISNGFDNVQDGKMKKTDALKVRKLDAYAKGIVNLEGLQNFKNVTNFRYAGDARDIDLSSNKLIDTIFIAKSYKLESINLTGITTLKYVFLDALSPLNSLKSDWVLNSNLLNFTFSPSSISNNLNIPEWNFSKCKDIRYILINIPSLKKVDIRGVSKFPSLNLGSDSNVVVCVDDVVSATKNYANISKEISFTECK